MKKYIIIMLLIISGVAMSQRIYPLVTIQDIQYVPDSLQGTDPPSRLNGDTVRVRGIVLARPVIHPDTSRGVILSAGARWCTYIQDPNSGMWGGLNILQEDTVGAAQGTFFDLVDTNQVVEFTGRILEYNTTTEMMLITAPQPIPVSIISTVPRRPIPIEVSLSDFFTPTGGYNFNAEKYEGMYVIIRNVLTSDRVTGSGSSSGNFKINDGFGRYAFIYNQSRYFKANSSGIIPGYQPPLDGSILSYVRGIVTTRTDGYYIVPVYPGDIGPTMASPPVISSIRRNNALVTPNQSVDITATVKDLDGYVTESKLFYRVNNGSLDSLTMTKQIADTNVYKTTIPGVMDSSLVSFYIRAKDNSGRISYNPTDTATGKYFYLVLNRPVTIKDVQYSPFGSGFSAYNNYRVQISGIVTADTSDIPGYTSTPLRIYMQDGSGPWNGIQIGTRGTLGINVLSLRRGDKVNAEGVIWEDYNVTKIDSLSLLTVVSSNNPLPAPAQVNTGSIGIGDSQVDKEKWESVLIKYVNVKVDSGNADGSYNYGEILVNDNSGPTRVELQDGNHKYHNAWDSTMISNPSYVWVRKGNRFSEINGVLFFSFYNYKLVPRKDNDFVGYVSSSENEAVKPVEYKLEQNYPNPFNPATTISYSLPKAGNVTLKIFNVLGQEVKTLINEYQNQGNYKVTFDASALTSGVYFYSLNADNNVQIKKMMLIK